MLDTELLESFHALTTSFFCLTEGGQSRREGCKTWLKKIKKHHPSLEAIVIGFNKHLLKIDLDVADTASDQDGG